MNTDDVIRMMKTVYTVTLLDENRFRIRYGNGKETIISVESPTDYKRARGVIPWKEGDELPEDAIRRIRGG